MSRKTGFRKPSFICKIYKTRNAKQIYCHIEKEIRRNEASYHMIHMIWIRSAFVSDPSPSVWLLFRGGNCGGCAAAGCTAGNGARKRWSYAHFTEHILVCFCSLVSQSSCLSDSSITILACRSNSALLPLLESSTKHPGKAVQWKETKFSHFLNNPKLRSRA